ncbi:unnamed protein product [Echinostoma caproni]|uniref:Sulfate_transp domain-containing protein n=1 Tax=Echinostoma caproni TaxID=27848 RepID=A0A183AY55_9TREM|nr:unnamed protein product [Echinostoma caproni]
MTPCWDYSMPSITVPVWSLMPQLFADALIVGITGTFLTISLVKLFAIRYKTELNYNHELTSYGVISIACAFFASFAPAASVSRSAVCEGAGARTPLNGIASSVLIVFVLLYLGPYFSVTPTICQTWYCFALDKFAIAYRRATRVPPKPNPNMSI